MFVPFVSACYFVFNHAIEAVYAFVTKCKADAHRDRAKLYYVSRSVTMDCYV